jgi:hypothetical protein
VNLFIIPIRRNYNSLCPPKHNLCYIGCLATDCKDLSNLSLTCLTPVPCTQVAMYTAKASLDVHSLVDCNPKGTKWSCNSKKASRDICNIAWHLVRSASTICSHWAPVRMGMGGGFTTGCGGAISSLHLRSSNKAFSNFLSQGELLEWLPSPDSLLLSISPPTMCSFHSCQIPAQGHNSHAAQSEYE